MRRNTRSSVRNIYSHENMQRSELTGWHGFGPGVLWNSIVTSEMQGVAGEGTKEREATRGWKRIVANIE